MCPAGRLERAEDSARQTIVREVEIGLVGEKTQCIAREYGWCSCGVGRVIGAKKKPDHMDQNTKSNMLHTHTHTHTHTTTHTYGDGSTIKNVLVFTPVCVSLVPSYKVLHTCIDFTSNFVSRFKHLLVVW